MDISKLKCNKLPGLTSAFEPVIYDCPYSEQINDSLLRWVEDKAQVRVQGGALKTKFYSGSERDTGDHHILFDWIESIIVEAVETMSRWTNSA